MTSSTTKRQMTLEIWTDGACKGNPGIGGWGAFLRYGPHTKELFGGEKSTTNNRMELSAVINALKCLERPCVIHLHVDSNYVKDGITKWIHSWKRAGWRTASKQPVKNDDLWRELDALVQKHEIEWFWVKGHAGEAGNEKADELANKGCISMGWVPDGQ